MANLRVIAVRDAHDAMVQIDGVARGVVGAEHDDRGELSVVLLEQVVDAALGDELRSLRVVDRAPQILCERGDVDRAGAMPADRHSDGEQHIVIERLRAPRSRRSTMPGRTGTAPAYQSAGGPTSRACRSSTARSRRARAMR